VTNLNADLQLGCRWRCLCRVSCDVVFKLQACAACRDLLSARWCEPSLSVVDVRVGDDTAAGDAEDAEGYRFGPTRFSVVPRSATGHVSIRFVPDQDAGRLFELFR
jgi:acetylornithine deacetylase/succinyl-diaminopimelate desuccinylase-like protein